MQEQVTRHRNQELVHIGKGYFVFDYLLHHHLLYLCGHEVVNNPAVFLSAQFVGMALCRRNPAPNRAGAGCGVNGCRDY